MGASDRVNALVEGIPFVRSTSVEVFDLKLLLLIGFLLRVLPFQLVNALYTLWPGNWVNAAAAAFADGTFDREKHAKRASALVGWRPRPSTAACGRTT